MLNRICLAAILITAATLFFPPGLNRSILVFTPQRPRLRATPAEEQAARDIARIGRIVVQAFVPPRWRAEVEHRLYLAALGHFLQNFHKHAQPGKEM